MKTYSLSFKENILEKVYAGSNKSVKEIADEAGIPVTTIYTWKKNMNKNKKISLTGNKYNKSEKFDIIVSYYSLEEGLKGSFLREKGFFSSRNRKLEERFHIR